RRRGGARRGAALLTICLQVQDCRRDEGAMANRQDDRRAASGSSPACSMHEADDAYMGYAAKDELIAFLNELLEAERAGARVTLESAHAAESGPIAELMRNVQQDEAR